MRSNASFVTCAEGDAALHASPTVRWPSACSASIAPAAGMLAPARRGAILSPSVSSGQPPPCSNAANVAFDGAKVLVSCWKPPTAIVAMLVLCQSRGACDSAPCKIPHTRGRRDAGLDGRRGGAAQDEGPTVRRALKTGYPVARRPPQRRLPAAMMSSHTRPDASAPTPPSGTVTLLFTDIEGSTRLLEEQRAAMQVALPRHDALVRHCIVAHHGHVFKTGGDAFCAAFHTASDALAAALEAQRALHREPWP